jgi:hypothetical protein
MVTGLDYRHGVLVGKPGVGKTSLIRAELLPRLTREGYHPIYLPTSAGDLLSATRAALAELFAPGTLVPDGGPRDLLHALPVEQRQRVVLIYDQFDDLLTSDEATRRNKVVEWVRTCLKDSSLKTRFLFVLRSDVYAGRHELLPSSPSAGAIVHRHDLSEFSPDDARRILKLVVERREARFPRRLIYEIVNDLSYRDRVSPVLLQIVATSLKQRRIRSKHRYRAIGEAAAILEWYVVEQIQGAPDPRLAHDVLKQLAASAEWQPGVGRSLESIHAAIDDPTSGPSDERKAAVSNLLARLMSARLVLRNVDGTYGVPHPILHAAVVSAVAQVEAEAAPEVRNAVALLERYVSTYQSKHRVCIPFWHLRTICRYVPLRIRVENPAEALLWKSALIVQLMLGAIVLTLSSAALLGGLVMARVVVPYEDWDDPIRLGMPVDREVFAPNPKVVGFLPRSKRLVLAHTDTTSNLGALYAVDYSYQAVTTVGGRAQATIQHVETGAPLTAIAIHPEGDGLASGDEQGVVKIWNANLRGGKVLPERRDISGSPCADPRVSYLSYGAGGVRLIVSRCQMVEVWDTVQDRLLDEIPLPEFVPPDAIRADPSGDFVALIEASGQLDLDDPGPLLTPISRVFVWAVRNDKLERVYDQPVVVKSSGVLEVGFAPGGRLVVATMEQMRLMRLTYDRTDASKWSPDVLGELASEPSKSAMSSDGAVIAITDGHSTWWIWRDRPWWWTLRGRAVVPEVLNPTRWSSSFMSADGKALLLTGSPRHTLFTHDFRLFHLSRLWPFEDDAESIAAQLGSPWR